MGGWREPVEAVRTPGLDRLLGRSSCSPGGGSLKPIPVSGTALPAGLVMTIVKVTLPLRVIVSGLKVTVIVGGLATWVLAEAAFPVPPLVEVTAPLVFV